MDQLAGEISEHEDRADRERRLFVSMMEGALMSARQEGCAALLAVLTGDAWLATIRATDAAHFALYALTVRGDIR